MEWETVIGCEVHVHLATRTKMFCACANAFGAEANTQVCPVCSGMPGVLPVVNEEAFRLGVRAALALGCSVAGRTRFDRKSYYYPDLPKNYQISQYDNPLAEHGAVEFEVGGQTRRVRITRAHLEEDAGKLLHPEGERAESAVDLNRAGVPLLEIVTEPELRSPEEAVAYLQALQQILRYIGASEAQMQEGSMRCEPNISIRPAGSETLGTKTEVKNLNSFKAVGAALEYEVKRQQEVLESGGAVEQATMLWDEEKRVTRTMRTKEEAQDYRYFPEPDLPFFTIARELVAEIEKELPELPRARRTRFAESLGLSEYDAGVLTADKAMADYYEDILKSGAPAKEAANWVINDVMRVLGEEGIGVDALKVRPAHLAELVALVADSTINATIARQEVFPEMVKTGESPRAIVKTKNLAQVTDTGFIDKIIEEAIAANPKPLADYKGGKKTAFGFFIGQVMRAAKGKANPQVVRERLGKRLDGET